MIWRNLTRSRPARFLGSIAREFGEHDDLTQAAAVAFYTTLSFGPLVMLVFTLGAFLGGSMQSDLIRFFDQQLGPTAGEVTQSVVAAAEQRRAAMGSLPWMFSLLLLLVSAGGVFGQIQSAMNVIFQARAPKRSGWWAWVRRRLLSMGMVLASLFILLVSLVLSSMAEHLLPRDGPIGRVLVFASSLVVATLLFAAIFRFLPDTPRRLPWRQTWLGAATTAGLFSVGKMVLGLYLEHGGVTQGYDRAAGALLALLVWVYYSAVILFVGAEITRHFSPGEVAESRAANEKADREVEEARPRRTASF